MPVRPGSDDTLESYMIYVTINEAFYHKEFAVKSPLNLNVCQGILGYPPYGVKQIAQDQPAIKDLSASSIALRIYKE